MTLNHPGVTSCNGVAQIAPNLGVIDIHFLGLSRQIPKIANESLGGKKFVDIKPLTSKTT